MDKEPITAYIISLFLAPAIIITCTEKVPFFWAVLYGIKCFFRLPYRNPEDLIVIMVLVFIIFLFFAMRGSIYSRLVWLGFLLSFMYIFILFSLTIYFNSGSLFPILYGFLFALTLFALIEGVKSLNINAITEQFPQKMPRKVTSAYLILSNLIFVPMVSSWILSPLLSNYPIRFSDISLLDISLVVLLNLVIITLYLSSFVMLLKRKSKGYIFALILFVWGTIPIITFISFENMHNIHSYFEFHVFQEYHLNRGKTHTLDYSIWLVLSFFKYPIIVLYHLASYFFILFYYDFFKKLPSQKVKM